ncbi:TIGR03084 family metal-binding protein [Janibacter alittae]|uniref:TIGR03084 family metal-binding protein n=1 Tax=Janibacter alittae TaxID=3115209 RepID=A0ABZ2ML34_9MICO
MSDTVASFLDECADLDVLVADLDDEAWAQSTPAQGWTIAHQIAHLAWTDEIAAVATTDPQAFADEVEIAVQDPVGHVDTRTEQGAVDTPAEILARWRDGRETLAQVLRDAPADTKLPWFGPPMSPRSMATARLMETWAHGQDVADALGVRRAPTARLRDICHLGVRTRDFAYLINDLTPPVQPFRIELTGPDGDLWIWGDEDGERSADRVTGPAQDFCLVVTQRRDAADTDLHATGEAVEWLSIAQVFAGAPRRARA